VNLTGSFLLSRAALSYMIEGGGSIVFIASQRGRLGSAGRAAYCGTKGAPIDHAKQNTRVNTLSPGGVEAQRTLQRYASLRRASRPAVRRRCRFCSARRGPPFIRSDV